ncbi:MAG: carbamoyltransferase HypF [Thermoplasmatota archaeon]|nr:carbamoyltransferase HypF [Candidatus Thermoplasmatota archaeon]MBU1914235.1 carbamoyltransferase HypF [Candidatus Thermoplasmatota archaeon]
MKITVYGVVQGVGFRPTVYRVAKAMNLRGYVLNNGSNVEIHIDRDAEKFLKELRNALPALARIDRAEFEEVDEKLEEFSIVKSHDGARVSLIPTDTAICMNCVVDFRRSGDRRYLFPFTNCTECGARFTVIADLPFDRPRTSMSDFPMCPDCTKEYASPDERRFHAQTISCPECGPTYTLYDSNRKEVGRDPFREFAKRINEGAVGLLKGWGGMHIICTFDNAARLRKIYRRGDKPYAVMMRDLETAKKYVLVTEAEENLLTSPQRPIVLLHKRESAKNKLERISPGLGNLGVMLPYSGAHLLMFHHLEADGVIMTSANPPGEPMAVENEKAFELGLDCYLMHNRRIIHRCDDSVVKINSERTNFTRKSRGFVPVPVEANHKHPVIGVGAQWDVTGSVSRNGEIFLTQYVGESQQYPTLQYLDDAIHHLSDLLGMKWFEAIGLDRHPRYSTRIVAKRLAREYGAQLIETQHYHAHAAALKIDRKIEGPLVCLTWDGTGYGDDGSSWGGETLLADFSEYKRLGTLEGIPLLGGDRAVIDPKRVVTAIQLKLGIEPTMAEEKDIEVYSRMLDKSVTASSMGRVLDSVSCILGICCKRTYEGEPAIKLEKWLETGKSNEKFDLEFGRSGNVEVARTLPMFRQLLEMRIETDRSRADAAASFVRTLVTGVADRACGHAESNGLKQVGVTGGVSYSGPITAWVKEAIERRGLEFIGHERISNGDGGISTGQNAIAGSLVG